MHRQLAFFHLLLTYREIRGCPQKCSLSLAGTRNYQPLLPGDLHANVGGDNLIHGGFDCETDMFVSRLAGLTIMFFINQSGDSLLVPYRYDLGLHMKHHIAELTRRKRLHT